MGPYELMFEISAEVCFQMGGIHTVILSKIQHMQRLWGGRYALIGPYISSFNYTGVLEAVPDHQIPGGHVQQAVVALREMGVNIHAGFWQVPGNPFVILIDPVPVPPGFDGYRSEFLHKHRIEAPAKGDLINLYIRFGYYLEAFFRELCAGMHRDHCKVMAHFHEYMTTVALPAIRQLPVHTVFTTHATVLGRFLASRDRSYGKHTPEHDWHDKVRLMSRYHRFCLMLERLAARHCHVLTSVSAVTAAECSRFLGRTPEVITPNGLNVENIQGTNGVHGREAIRSVVSKHFAGDPAVNGNTYYFFTSGRYEYRNKGYDVVVRALAKLNRWLRESTTTATVVMFFITDSPYPKHPDWVYRIRQWASRALSLRKSASPGIFLYDVPDAVSNSHLVSDLKRYKLGNQPSDRVKVLYHPRFVTAQGPGLRMTYLDFVKGCDLGIFPSHYEPWGLTPAECISACVPTVTTSMTGFARYISTHTHAVKDSGIFILDRHQGDTTDALFNMMKDFVTERKNYRQALQEHSRLLDWSNMITYYDAAYKKAMP